MFYFDTRYDLESGLWQFRIEINGTNYWSKPMTANQIETVVRYIQQRRGASEALNLNMRSINAAEILATGVLSNDVQITKCPPTHPSLVKAAAKRQVSDLQSMTAEQILAKLGPLPKITT